MLDEKIAPQATESPQERRVKMTRIVSPKTIERLETLETIFETKQGRIIDRLVLCLWEARATKQLKCITGSSCRFNLAFPDTNIL